MWTSMCQLLLMEVAMATEPLVVEPRAEAATLAAAELPELKVAERRELAVAEPPVTRVPAAAIPAVKRAAATT